MELVSIIVPLYNAENYIESNVKSILSQSYKNLEVIYVNDGSTDSSLPILKSLVNKDSRIKIISQQNQGASVARNNGMKEATGEFLMFIDADDYIEVDMVLSLVKLMKVKDVDLVISCLNINYYNNQMKLERTIKNFLKEEKITGNKNIAENIVYMFENESINGPTCKLYKSDIIKKNNIKMPKHIHLQEDLYFNVQYLKYCNSIYTTAKAYYYYNHFPTESVTSRFYSEKWGMLNEVNNNVLDYYIKRTKNSEVIGNIYFLNVKNIYASIIHTFHEKNNQSVKTKINYIKYIVRYNYENEKLIHAYKKGIKYQLLLRVLKTNNAFFIYIFCNVLYVLKSKLKIKY